MLLLLQLRKNQKCRAGGRKSDGGGSLRRGGEDTDCQCHVLARHRHSREADHIALREGSRRRRRATGWSIKHARIPGRDGHVSVPTDTGWTFTTYQSHYNSRSNKCFYLLKREGHRENYRDSRGLYKIIMLIDLHENRGIGSYEGMTTERTMEEKTFDCLVQEKKCKSEEEWRALIKPFMED